MQPQGEPVTFPIDLRHVDHDEPQEQSTTQGTASMKSVPHKYITRRALLQGVGTTGLVLPLKRILEVCGVDSSSFAAEAGVSALAEVLA